MRGRFVRQGAGWHIRGRQGDKPGGMMRYRKGSGISSAISQTGRDAARCLGRDIAEGARLAVMAAASPERSGDQLAGIAAESALQRVAARLSLRPGHGGDIMRITKVL
ncbi:ethanolamine ammonia-lyase subunit EutB [Paracoccus yeei]|uniref:ethanolamine ammonia-lyase subunit EutB n=1 Tax=Paracoccus yeei TaxID=147645 RepID=UPI0037CD6995